MLRFLKNIFLIVGSFFFCFYLDGSEKKIDRNFTVFCSKINESDFNYNNKLDSIKAVLYINGKAFKKIVSAKGTAFQRSDLNDSLISEKKIKDILGKSIKIFKEKGSSEIPIEYYNNTFVYLPIEVKV